jgi:tetraacyldisaccharide 4'-kinase
MTSDVSGISPQPSSFIPLPTSLQPVAAFCALGNPAAFFALVRSNGHDASYTRAFPDHHAYRQTDLDALVMAAKQRGARALLTTAKDAVKLRSLRFDLPCYVMEIGLEFDEEEKLTGMIREAIKVRPD